MGKSDILTDEGSLEYWWNSEDHTPPHFHVSKVDGEWEIRVFFPKCEPDKLEYEFKFPSSRIKRISSEHEQEILKKMSNTKGSIMKRQLFNEWKEKVVKKDNHTKK
jgi:hypothetical protein